jgi:hypothetical protein
LIVEEALFYFAFRSFSLEGSEGSDGNDCNDDSLLHQPLSIERSGGGEASDFFSNILSNNPIRREQDTSAGIDPLLLFTAVSQPLDFTG